HVVGFKQKRRECKYCDHQINDSLRAARTHFRNCDLVTSEQKKFILAIYEENNNNISTNIPDTSSPAVSTFASVLVASTSSTSTSLNESTSSISNKKVSTKNTRITNYITSDCISKTEQKLLELEFARSIFQ
ncbi:18477_t:CDS:1, partial [Gigaspora rosea]